MLASYEQLLRGVATENRGLDMPVTHLSVGPAAAADLLRVDYRPPAVRQRALVNVALSKLR